LDGGEGEGPAPFFGHSRYLFDTSVHVPLLVKPPRSLGIAPAREHAVVTTASVASTLLHQLGVEGADELVGPLPGLDLPGPATGLAFSVARNPSRTFDRASVRRGAWRLIETRNEPQGIALYRLEDGGESPDLAAAEPETTRELLQLLHALHPSDAAGAGRPGSKLSDRELRMLEELGYVE
jgi:arylsulfatase A-like enzyme